MTPNYIRSLTIRTRTPLLCGPGLPKKKSRSTSTSRSGTVSYSSNSNLRNTVATVRYNSAYANLRLPSAFLSLVGVCADSVLHAWALARAFGERHKVPIQGRILFPAVQPALGGEGVWVFEDGWVVEDIADGHTDGSLGAPVRLGL